MTTTPGIASQAYASTMKLGSQAGSETKAAAKPGDFAELVKSAITQTSESGKATETAMADLVAGKADVVDVVTAVAETEVALETMVAVRDKVIAAYQEILNMPI